MEPTEPTGDHSFEEVRDKLARLDKIQDALARLVSDGKGNEDVHVFHINEAEQVPTDDTLRLYEGKRTLDASTARKGDVIWWKSRSGTTGYFLVSDESSPEMSAKGSLRMIKEDGTVSREYPEATLEGGGFGMVQTGRVVENMPLWFGIPRKEDPGKTLSAHAENMAEDEFKDAFLPKSVHTNSVVEMGVIRNDALPQDG